MRSRRLILPAAVLLALGLAALFAPRTAPAQQQSSEALTSSDWPMDGAALRGREVYEKYCIGCHGENGRGDGAAVPFLNPRPRDFQKGKFKFRSTPSSQLPTVDDLVKTITCGLNGSSMPGFPLVAETSRRDVAQYVLHLAGLGKARAEVRYLLEEEGLSAAEIRAEHLERIRDEVAAEIASARPIDVPAPLPESPELVARGKRMFDEQCAACHGATGRGDGSSSYTLRDWKDGEIRPRDLTTGVFRAGSSASDLYLRLRTGLTGTPMPAIKGPEEDVWGLVYYIQSLRDPGARPPQLPYGCGPEGAGR